MANTWNRNTWDRNTWDRNTWNSNTWNHNTWNRNTWNHNTWNRNTWDRNTWYHNTWNRNTWNRNTWYLNTVTPKLWLVFNVMTNIEEIKFPNWFYFDVKSKEWNYCCIWVTVDSMTKDEKESNKTHETIWWYIKVSLVDKDMKTHWRKAFDECKDLEDIRSTFDVPNFDYDIFEEISGISKEDFDTKLWTKKSETIVVNWVTYKKV